MVCEVTEDFSREHAPADHGNAVALRVPAVVIPDVLAGETAEVGDVGGRELGGEGCVVGVEVLGDRGDCWCICVGEIGARKTGEVRSDRLVVIIGRILGIVVRLGEGV